MDEKGSWPYSSDVSIVHQDNSWLCLFIQLEKENVSVINIESKSLSASSVYINLAKSEPIKNDSSSRKSLKNSEVVTKNVFACF